jgi:hypothetical protein
MAGQQSVRKPAHPAVLTLLLLAIVVVIFFTLGYVLSRVII